MADPPKTTRLSSDLTKPQPTAAGDAPADTWDQYERAHSAHPDMAAAVAAGAQSVNAVVPGDPVPADVVPVITTPADGATVPTVHSVDGTAPAGATVALFHDERADGDFHPTGHTVTATADGTFGFDGSTPAVPGLLAWRVEADGVTSAPVTVTVSDA